MEARERSGNKQGGSTVTSSSDSTTLSERYLSSDLVLEAPWCNYA